MRANYDMVKESALAFTARFGFITRDIFFEYLCPLKKTRQYVYWKKLQEQCYIKPARSFANIFYLTPLGRKTFSLPSAPARSALFVQHDTFIASLLFELMASGLVLKSWTDYELMKKKADAYAVLGCDRLEKIPDLVVEMKAKTGSLKIAFEVERSRKSDAQYDQIALNYLGLKNINLVIYACNNQLTAKAIARAFNFDLSLKNEKFPAIFLTETFKKNKTNAESRYFEKILPLKHLLLAALELPNSEWRDSVKNSRKPFRENSTHLKKCI